MTLIFNEEFAINPQSSQSSGGGGGGGSQPKNVKVLEIEYNAEFAEKIEVS